MSAVSESMNRRMTLGLLASRYGFDLDPTSAAEVTITSIADDVESVRPGALFVPSADVDVHQLSQAQEQGAYGAIVPHALRGQTDDIQIPLIYAEPTMGQLGKLVSDMAGNPSDALAVFAITGKNREIVESDVRNLADFLHMLGNPVGVISSSDSQSLERFLNLGYPLSAIDMQRTMAVCAEDGAAAVRCRGCETRRKIRMRGRQTDPHRGTNPGIRPACGAGRDGIRPDGQPFAVPVHRHGAGRRREESQHQKRVTRLA